MRVFACAQSMTDRSMDALFRQSGAQLVAIRRSFRCLSVSLPFLSLGIRV